MYKEISQIMKQPFLARGMAKGPTPANTSKTVQSLLIVSANLLCSVLSRLFQNT